MGAQEKFDKMIIKPWAYQAAKECAKKIWDGKARYDVVAQRTGYPWDLIGLIHQREADGRWDTNLANGQTLKKRTTEEPKGRPIGGTPPFSWEFAAEDALRDLAAFKGVRVWDVNAKAEALEVYNGLGYRKRDIPSPYVWSGSQWYEKGKFTGDHHFDPNFVDKQVGGMVVLKVLQQMDGANTMILPKKKSVGLLALLASFFAMIGIAHASDTGTVAAIGDSASAVVGVILPIAETVVMGVLSWGLGKVAPWAVGFLKTQATEQLLTQAINWGLNAVEGAAKGKTLDINTGNAVLNEALAYAVDKGPTMLINWLGGPENIQHMILARLNLDENASAQKLGVASLSGN